MIVVKRKCDKCGTALEWDKRCDYCGEVISGDEVFHYYLIAKRTDPESTDEHTFHFCGYEHMTKWMQNRQVTYYDGEECGATPYSWEDESRNKFDESKISREETT